MKSLSKHGIPNTGILTIKITLNRACRNYYLDSCYKLTVLLPVPRGISFKKSFWIKWNASKGVFRIMYFPEFIVNHESQ